MRVGDICNRDMFVAHPSTTAAEAADRLHREGIGTLVVLDERGRLVGLVSDRDLVVQVVARGRNPARVRVEEVMHRDPPVVRLTDEVVTALEIMNEADLRRLPVVDEHGKLQGLVTVGDLLDMYAGDRVDVARTTGWRAYVSEG